MIISLTRRGSLEYAKEMCCLLEAFNPLVVFSGPQKLRKDIRQEVFETYRNPISFVLQTIAALIRIPYFLWKKKHQQAGAVLYFTVFHPWNGLFIFFGRLMGYTTILTVHDFKTHKGEHNPFIEWIQKQQMRKADKLVFLTQFVRDQAQSELKHIETRSYILAHPLFQDFGSNNLPYNSKPSILVLGRMKSYKGIPLLLETLQELDYSKLTIAGMGASEYRQSDMAISIEDSWLSTQRIHELLLRHEILVLPYSEASQSGVLALGISASCAIVATNVGGLLEQADEASILWVEANKASLKEGLSKVINNKEVYDSLKLNVRLLKQRSNAAMKQQIEELFHEIN